MLSFGTDHMLDHVSKLLACDVEWCQIRWFLFDVSLDEGFLWIKDHRFGFL